MADPYRLDFRARGNADFGAIITVALDGQPYDLTNCTLAAKLRLPGDISGGAAVIALTNQTSKVEGVGVYGTDPTQGQVYMQINAATLAVVLATSAVNEVRLWWDLQVIKPSGGGYDVPVEGAFVVHWGATR